MTRIVLLLAILACARPAHWPPKPAQNPPTRAELAAYELTVKAVDPAEHAAFGQALAARGFKVVDHEPYRLQLEVTLTHEDETLVATLQSDGWFVDEAVGKNLQAIAETLAVSQRVADFIRNSGLPQQHPTLNLR